MNRTRWCSGKALDLYSGSTSFESEGRDSSVGIATRHGLDGLRFEHRLGGRDFPDPSQTGHEAHSAACTMSIGFLSRG